MNKFLRIGIIIFTLFHGTVLSDTPKRIFIYNTYNYDTIINLIANDTTEYIMDFTEDGVDQRMYPSRVHVSTNDSVDSNYPIFVTATQKRGVSSWQLPLSVRAAGGELRYTNMARTLCPYDDTDHNVTSSPPLLQVSTSSPRNVSVDIKLRRVQDFYIEVDKEVRLTAAPGTPKFYYFSFDHTPANVSNDLQFRFNYTIPKSVILIIDSDDDICASISIQNNSCPVFDNEKDMTYQGYYFTMLTKGGITLTQSMFPSGFYVVFITMESDAACGIKSNHAGNRTKEFRFRVVATISYLEYVWGAAALLAGVVAVAALAAALLVAGGRLMQPTLVQVPTSAADAEEESLVPDDTQEAEEREAPMERWEDMRMSSLCKSPPERHEERSNRYFWILLTVSIVYALPVVQLLAAYQRMIFSEGDQDLCYYNFLCAHPLGPLADFNHVYSNIGYIVLGLVFMAIVRRRQLQARKRASCVGVRPHWGLQYAVGLALIMEGVLSAAYHLCPNKMNFQFDSSFMYLVGVLTMLELCARRRPDRAPPAHRAALALAATIATGVFGIMYPSVYFSVLFTALHLWLCAVVIVDLYYIGTVTIDLASLRRAYSAVRVAGAAALVPRRRCLAALLAAALAANVALAVYG